MLEHSDEVQVSKRNGTTDSDREVEEGMIAETAASSYEG
jgi:hypothetical protein